MLPHEPHRQRRFVDIATRKIWLVPNNLGRSQYRRASKEGLLMRLCDNFIDSDFQDEPYQSIQQRNRTPSYTGFLIWVSDPKMFISIMLSSQLTRRTKTITTKPQCSVGAARWNSYKLRGFTLKTRDTFSNKRNIGSRKAQHDSIIFHKALTPTCSLEDFFGGDINNSWLSHRSK